MSSKELLEKNPQPTQEEIEYALDGNICRCAGYPKIFDAVRKAGEVMKQGWNTQTEETTNKVSGPEKIVMGITYEDYVKNLEPGRREVK